MASSDAPLLAVGEVARHLVVPRREADEVQDGEGLVPQRALLAPRRGAGASSAAASPTASAQVQRR